VDLGPGKNVDIVLKNAYAWREVKSDTVDVLVSGQAFEHIEFFWITALEIARVLKPGGLCCIIAPSSGPEHKYPVDCWRFYPDGFASLARFMAFEIVELFTQWEDRNGYTDRSNKWHDTVLIAKKPEYFGLKGLQQKLRRFILHRILYAMAKWPV
jgi:SAM-dependent methyltransferase